MKKRESKQGKNIKKWLFFGVFLGIVLVVLVLKERPDRYLHVVFCDVGQGDAAMVIKGKLQLLVDSGPDDRVLACLGKNMPFWDREIEMAVITHPEADHIGGLASVLKRYRVDRLVKTIATNESDQYQELERLVKEMRVPVSLVSRGFNLRLGEIGFKVLWPEKDKVGNEESLNETSIVMLGSYGKFDFLLSGDAGVETEEEILREGGLKRIELLKVGHHGSKFSSSQEWLEKLKPGLAVISVGEKNRFGHPTKEVLDRLKVVGAKTARTDLAGEIEVVSDGVSYWVK